METSLPNYPTSQFPAVSCSLRVSVILVVAMTLMDAEQFDYARQRRRRRLIAVSVILLLFAAWVAYHLRHYPERNAASKFVAALQSGNYESAYAVWFNDPEWKQHTNKYS